MEPLILNDGLGYFWFLGYLSSVVEKEERHILISEFPRVSSPGLVSCLKYHLISLDRPQEKHGRGVQVAPGEKRVHWASEGPWHHEVRVQGILTL